MSTNDYLPFDEPWAARIRAFQTKPPVEIVLLAETLGVKVWERNLPANVGGLIMRDPSHGGAMGFSVIVSKADSLPRKRYAVAHELAHFLLHRDLIGDELSDNVLFLSRLNSLQEVQANKLAMEILMPLYMVERELRSGALSIKELASRFQVTEQAMSLRLGVPS